MESRKIVCEATGKSTYPGENAAKQFLRRRAKFTDNRMNVYFCEHCHGWHIGNQ